MSRKKNAGPPEPEPAREPERPRLSSRHRDTLAKLFDRPDRPDIPWRDVERLFIALGASVSEGAGSRVRVALGGALAVFHEPHPERVTDKGAVADVRRFLRNSGVVE